MQDSITMAEVGSMVKVSGSRIATPLGPPRPGSTPTKMPSTSPTIISASVFQVSRTAKPCRSRPKASIKAHYEFRRHCEEPTGPALLGRPDDRLRDEAIHRATSGGMDCFASLAMTRTSGYARGLTGRTSKNAIPPARPQRPEGFADLPGHHDVRRPDRRGDLGAHHREGARGRNQFHRL